MFFTRRALLDFPWAYKHDVFTPEECKHIIAMGKKLEQMDGTIGNKDSDSYSVNKDIRRSKVGAFHPGQDTAWIFERVSHNINLLNNEFFKYDIYGFDYIQFGQYDAKDRGLYSWHPDTMYNEANLHPGLFRKLSISILLNHDFDGGKFQIMMGGPDLVNEPEMHTGTMLIFPSYLTHQVTEVTKGCRMSLVIWVVGPKFR